MNIKRLQIGDKGIIRISPKRYYYLRPLGCGDYEVGRIRIQKSKYIAVGFDKQEHIPSNEQFGSSPSYNERSCYSLESAEKAWSEVMAIELSLELR